jgi:hypoxanthine phosphoribosyltransferase
VRAPPGFTLREIVSAERVRARLDALAAKLAADYAGGDLVLVVIAEGARHFAGRLAERLRAAGVGFESHELRVRRTQGTRLDEVRIDAHGPVPLAGRDALVVDDIIDEGRTLEAVIARLEPLGPRTLRVAVLVSKLARRTIGIDLDYVGFEIGDGWVVGCGMDLDGAYRELDWIGVAEPAAPQ